MFPIEMFVLGCQANGLSSIVMEGFDGRHVRDLVGFSKRYFVTGLVPFGYAKESDVKPTQRYPPGLSPFLVLRRREDGVR